MAHEVEIVHRMLRLAEVLVELCRAAACSAIALSYKSICREISLKILQESVSVVLFLRMEKC